MARPEGARAVDIGVRLDQHPTDLSAWLTDAAAFDAAGANALWIDIAPEPQLDPLALAAALAAVTYRSLLVMAPPPDVPAPTLDTVRQLSRGRLRLLAEILDHEHQHWVPTPVPDSRAGWRTALAEAAERGVHGLLVPADPRLLDLLRNPDDPGERHDLQLAQG